MIKDQFSGHFIQELKTLFSLRRDVRAFQKQPVPAEILDELLSIAAMAPSVGLSEPWRFIQVQDDGLKQQVYDLFKKTNAEASQKYQSEQQELYHKLKLSGLDDAPHHIAVFSEENPDQGKGLGRQTMPLTTQYSTVMAIFSFWLAARARGIGVGWVSILPPQKIQNILQVPNHWTFVAYLCVGYPTLLRNMPELEEKGWETRNPKNKQWIIR